MFKDMPIICQKMLKLCLLLLSFDLYVSLAWATTLMPEPIQVKLSEFQQLTLDQQKVLASVWHLEHQDYRHYLWLMQHTPNAWYYANQYLDPSWILGFNAKDEAERKKFAAIALDNERRRIANELAFQRVFYQLQKELHPDEVAISYQALREK